MVGSCVVNGWFCFFMFLSSTYREMFYCRVVTTGSYVIDIRDDFFCYFWLEISHSIFFSLNLIFFSNKIIYFTSISISLLIDSKLAFAAVDLFLSLLPLPHNPFSPSFTKVFVGGLAWETPTDVMRRRFEQFGDIMM